MAEALVLARSGLGDDGGSGANWRWARGHIVSVQPDGFAWAATEDPRNFQTAAQRKFALLRFPGISVTRIQKYLAQQNEFDQFTGRFLRQIRGALWQVQWTALPQAAKNILIATGVLTIGPASVGGDFTWAQVKAYLLRMDTLAQDEEAMV